MTRRDFIFESDEVFKRNTNNTFLLFHCRPYVCALSVFSVYVFVLCSYALVA